MDKWTEPYLITDKNQQPTIMRKEVSLQWWVKALAHNSEYTRSHIGLQKIHINQSSIMPTITIILIVRSCSNLFLEPTSTKR